MANTVITPQPGEAVITTGDDYRRDHDRLEHDILRENLANFRSLDAQVERNKDFMTASSDRRHEFTLRQMDSDVKSLGSAIGNVGEETAEAAAATQLLAAQAEGRSLVEAAKNAAAQILESAKNTAALNVQAEKNVAALGVQAEKLAAASTVNSLTLNSATNVLVQTKADAATLFAAQNAAAIASQVAECCCTVRESIRSDGDKTRDAIDDLEERINEIESLRNAVDLVDAKTEISYLKSRVPSGTPV